MHFVVELLMPLASVFFFSAVVVLVGAMTEYLRKMWGIIDRWQAAMTALAIAATITCGLYTLARLDLLISQEALLDAIEASAPEPGRAALKSLRAAHTEPRAWFALITSLGYLSCAAGMAWLLQLTAKQQVKQAPVRKLAEVMEKVETEDIAEAEREAKISGIGQRRAPREPDDG